MCGCFCARLGGMNCERKPYGARAARARAYVDTATGPRAVPARSGYERNQSLECDPCCPGGRTRCEPGRLAVRSVRSRPDRTLIALRENCELCMRIGLG